MNTFGFRFTRDGMNYRAEYRLSHWAGFRIVRDDRGKPVSFDSNMDAAIHAAQALVDELNGNPNFWTGPTGNEARAAAEKLFTRAADGGEGKEN